MLPGSWRTVAIVVVVGCGGDAPKTTAPTLVPSSIPPPEAPKKPKLTAIEAGTRTTCGVADDKTVWCWGWTTHGPSGVPRQVEGLADVAEVSVGFGHWCARLTSGKIRCWGQGQAVGMPSNAWRVGFYDVPEIDDAERVVSANIASCALRRGGKVSCWGLLARPGRFFEGHLQHIELPGPASDLVAGEEKVCALVHKNAWCWTRFKKQPKRVMHSGYVKIALGLHGGLCGVTEGGQLDCVGRPCHGAFSTWRPEPCHVQLTAGVTDVVAGRSWCARVSGSYKCWGNNLHDEVQPGAGHPVDLPVDLLIDERQVKDLAPGWAHVCALLRDGDVTCWGSNYRGELGRGRPAWLDQRLVLPRKVTGPKQLAVGENHICLIGDPAPVCWGTKRSGASELSKVGLEGNAIHAAAGATRIASAHKTICAVRHGAVVCWGDDYAKEPFLAPFEGMQLLEAGRDTRCGIVGDERELSCWGAGYYLQLDGARNRVSGGHEPQVLDEGPVLAVGVGRRHACWARADGSILCRGSGVYDAEGKHHRAKEPILVTKIDGVQAIAAGYDFTCVLAKGALSCWGYNVAGNVGGGVWDAEVPLTKLPLEDVREVAAMAKHACAVTGDGAVWCWGENAFGELGTGDRISRNAPTRVLGVEDVEEVRIGDGGTCAVENDGEVVCWGELAHEILSKIEYQFPPAPALPLGATVAPRVERRVLSVK